MNRKIFVWIIACLGGFTTTIAQTDSIAEVFKNTEVKVILPQDYYLSGAKVEAEILLVEKDSAKKATAFVEGWHEIEMKEGRAKYTTIAMGVGTKTIEGYVDYFIGDRYRRYGFRKDYTVHKGGAIIALNNFNVLYKGIDNPMTISVPGTPQENIIVSMSNGALTKKAADFYIARVNKSGRAKFNVSIKTDVGGRKNIGAAEYRILDLPKLNVSLNEIGNGDVVELDKLKAAVGKNPRIHLSVDKSFPYQDFKLSTSSFTISILKAKGENPNPITIKGQMLSPESIALINKLQTGDKLIIDAIQVANPNEAWQVAPYVITVQ
jgi:gliding motility-associated protein GldM